MAAHKRKARRPSRRRPSRRMKFRAPKRRAAVKRRAAPVRRRRASRNPKSPLSSPSVRFAAAAGVGAGVSLAVEASGVWGERGGSALMRSAMTALLVYAAAHFLLKGKKRQMGYAVAVGALIPPAANSIAGALQPALGGMSSTSTQIRSKTAKAIAPSPAQRSASAHAKAARANLIH